MRMKVDKEADALYIRFDDAKIVEVAPGIMLDFNAEGEVIGVEILYVSQRMAKRKAA